LAYGAWRDGGLTVLDVADPTRPRLLVHRNWDPPFGGGTHSPLPLPDRNLLVVGDEPTTASCTAGLRYVWVFDVREPANPVSIATCPTPAEADYCAKGGNFGPHNLHENRPGSLQSSRLVFATYYNAGVRVYDIENPFQPREVGFYVPADPERMVDPRPNRPRVIQSCDCYVDPSGLMYLTDSNAGLNILQFEGPCRDREEPRCDGNRSGSRSRWCCSPWRRRPRRRPRTSSGWPSWPRSPGAAPRRGPCGATACSWRPRSSTRRAGSWGGAWRRR